DSYAGVREAGAILAERLIEKASAEPPTPDSGLFSREMPGVLSGLERLAGDSDPRVRFQAAFSLGAEKLERRAKPLEAIALHDAADPWTRAAVLTSVGGGA